jgi:hypothetical protein
MTRAGIEAVHTTETAGPRPRQARPVRCRVSKTLSKPGLGSSMVMASESGFLMSCLSLP